MLTETWLRDHLEAEVGIENYSIYRVDRTRPKKKRGRNSGGVAVYIQNNLPSSPEILLEHSCGVIEAICLRMPHLNLVVCSIYRQPNDPGGGNICTAEQLTNLIGEISEVLDSIPAPSPNIVIGGDFNLPHARWSSFKHLPGASSEEKRMINIISDFCSRHFLTQIVEQPTHRAGNILDLIFTNNPSIFVKVDITPASPISSHYLLVASTSLSSTGQSTGVHQREDTNGFDLLNLHSESTNWMNIKSSISNNNWINIFRDLSPTEMLEKILDVCQDAATKNAPKKLQRKYGARRKIPRERKILMKKRTRHRRQYKAATTQARKDSSFSKLTEIEAKLQESYATQDQREEDKAVEAIKSNPKYFYSFASRRSKSHNPIGPLTDDYGNHVSDPKEMANILSNQYKGAFSTPTQNPGVPSPARLTQIDDISFHHDLMGKAIDEVSSNSAPGPDRFPAILLKKCKEELCEPLCLMWRKSLDTGEIPDILKLSNITPIHKGGDRTIPKNYRPVALTSHLIKVFEKVVRRQIVDYIEGNQLMNPNQHGFRAGRSCLSQLLQHHDRITKLMEEGMNVDVIYLDFAKAFDKLDFNITIQKLHSIGITGKLLIWIQAFLTNRKQCVYVEGSKSCMEPVISGVPQGSVVGPLLFLIMLHDIDENIAASYVSSFADDTRVLAGISGADDVDNLQADLEKIYQWADKNNSVFNASKFQCLRYGVNKNIISDTVYYSNTQSTIESESSVSDLGVIMSSDAKFSEHITNITTKASLKCSWILRVFRTRERIPLTTLWKSLVIPILDYCSQLWCPSSAVQIQNIEKVQSNFFKKIAGMAHLDYWEQLRVLKMYSLQRRRERYICIYMWKILEDMVPNFGIEVMYNKRKGRYCRVPHIRCAAPGHTKTIRFSSMGVNGPRLFNVLPESLRNMSGCSIVSFKNALDRHLVTVPDEPRIPGLIKYCSRASNSLLMY